jgi:hypothetical protein
MNSSSNNINIGRISYRFFLVSGRKKAILGVEIGLARAKNGRQKAL